MALNKRTYVDHETKITAQNLNEIQDEIIANGLRSNANMQRLNAVGWTQAQIDAFKELLGITEHPEIDEPTYAVGDAFPDSQEVWLASGESETVSSQNSIYLMITTPKNLKNISTITFVPNNTTKKGFLFYGINGALDGGAWLTEDSGYSVTVTKVGNYGLLVKISKTSGTITNFAAKTPVTALLRGNFIFS